MDLYLPADFYRLRDDLNDWRDVGAATEPAAERTANSAADTCVDPTWQPL